MQQQFPDASPGNYFQPPKQDNTEEIRKVIFGQKLLIYSILINLVSLILAGTVHWIFMISYLGANIVACVGVTKLRGPVLTGGQMWVYCIGACVPAPGLNLLVMGIVSGMAVDYLKLNNVPVGLLGGSLPNDR